MMSMCMIKAIINGKCMFIKERQKIEQKLLWSDQKIHKGHVENNK